jgi:hypothetical protein
LVPRLGMKVLTQRTIPIRNQQVFVEFPKYSTNILMRDCISKSGRENMFEVTVGKGILRDNVNCVVLE